MAIIDISRTLHTGMAVWPGDTEYELQKTWQIDSGAAVNVGSLTMSTHTGTHVDAPYHFDPEGPTMEQMPVDIYVGEAHVIQISGVQTIDVPHLLERDLSACNRLLIRTGAWPSGEPFPERIPVLSAEAVQYVAALGIRLLGVDVPSVDPLDSTRLDNHLLLHQNDIAILESLDLDDVPEGVYELTALPLPLRGADGSPVRAVLRTIEDNED
jgi:arylformamidase